MIVVTHSAHVVDPRDLVMLLDGNALYPGRHRASPENQISSPCLTTGAALVGVDPVCAHRDVVLVSLCWGLAIACCGRSFGGGASTTI